MSSMRFGMDMTQRQSQSQIQTLSPKMYQSMAILQLPALDLQERIDQELAENPVLEILEKKDKDQDDFENEGEFEEKASDPDREELVIDGDNEADFDRMEALNKDWEDYFNEEHRPSRAALQEASDRKQEAMQNMAERPESLISHLEEQLHMLEDDSVDLDLIHTLIGYLDDRGYLAVPVDHEGKPLYTSLEELYLSFSPPVTVEEVEDALSVIQGLDPAGVGARDLKECLSLQVSPDMPHADLIHLLIQDHLQDIQLNRLPVIQKKTGFDLDTIQEAIEELRHLNPKPGMPFASTDNRPVVPDVIVEEDENGEYQVRLLDDWMPNLYVPRRYREMQKDRKTDKKTRGFLREKIQDALWLQEAIEQRRDTLMRVTKAIIAHQREFLDKGQDYIAPLKMQQIADQVEVHVTTVSRAIHDKWIETPRGIFPLKRFFGGGKQLSPGGEEVAWEVIKRKLLQIIDEEDKSSPFSDEDLVTELEKAGYPIKRRTVTKYRKMLSIPSSRQRKDWTL